MTEWKHAWKHPWMRVGILASVILLVCAVAFAWQGERYIEAAGIGLAPNGMSGAQAKAMTRRAAVVDLQRNFVKILGEGSPDGFIRGVEILEGTWDGTSYKVSGRVRLPAF
ncbi:MAG: hypothetical protein LBG29_06450 [Synergistaceae bacterium]|jgi:hypothetical protein|nr:hypothetical protein [Synergistaceae bacterium]